MVFFMLQIQLLFVFLHSKMKKSIFYSIVSYHNDSMPARIQYALAVSKIQVKMY